MVQSKEGEIKLTIELIPETCWYSNVRTNVPKSVWDRIRHLCYKKAKYRCEICGGKGNTHPVECHEKWEYDDKKKEQKLVGFVALCPDCHSVKHLGRTQHMGNMDEACYHIMRVNEWNDHELNRYLAEVTEVYQERSKHQWILNIEYMDKYLDENNKRYTPPTV